MHVNGASFGIDFQFEVTLTRRRGHVVLQPDLQIRKCGLTSSASPFLDSNPVRAAESNAFIGSCINSPLLVATESFRELCNFG